MTLSLETFTDPAVVDALTPEWEVLDAQISPRTPFTSPNWIRLWWRHLRRPRDSFFLHTLRASGRELIAVAPLILTRKPRFAPVRARIIQFIGADPCITEIRGLICQPQHQQTAIASLLEYLQVHHRDWDLFLWRGIRDCCAYHNLLAKMDGLQPDGSLSSYVIDLPESWDILLPALSSNMRKNIRKSYEFLARGGHRVEFRTWGEPSEVGPALKTFFALHAARAAAANMEAHPDRFSCAAHRGMLADLAAEMAKRGQLQVLELGINGTVVASRIAFLLSSELYLYYSGFDPSWKRFSVMTTLMIETIKWAIKNRLKKVNLSTGTDLSKLRWRPTEIRYYNLKQVSPTWRGQLASQAYEVLFRNVERASS
jgi:CelD/BcsL family acetyltransferase involved in cellulose biosynthesis